MAAKWQSLKKAQGVVGGGVMVICSLVLMWSGVSSDVSTDDQLDKVVAQAIEIDAERPDPNDNGKIVIAAASWKTDDRYEDEFLKPNSSLLVRRRVEMLQWVETRKEKETSPSYSLEWTEEQVDFFKFEVPQGHENPLPQIAPVSYEAPRSRFGGFDGKRLLVTIRALQPLALAPELLKDSSMEIAEGKLIIRRNPGMQLPSLGDMRVWYEVFPQDDYTVLTVQEDERSLIGANPSSKLFIQHGLLDSSDLLGSLEGGANSSFHGILYLGWLLLFVGLLSLMMPHSASFDLRPNLNVRGPLAVALVSLGISFVVSSLFFLLSFAG